MFYYIYAKLYIIFHIYNSFFANLLPNKTIQVKNESTQVKNKTIQHLNESTQV